jgi:hypothetical protein
VGSETRTSRCGLVVLVNRAPRRSRRRMPVRAGKHPAQDRTVGGAELGSLDLVAQHLDLMAEHGDLDIFGVLATEAFERHADEPACHEEGQAIGGLSPWPRPRCSAHTTEFLNPAAPAAFQHWPPPASRSDPLRAAAAALRAGRVPELPARPRPPAASLARPGLPAAVPHRRHGRRHRPGRGEGAGPWREAPARSGVQLPGLRRPGRPPVLPVYGVTSRSRDNAFSL